MDPLVSTIHALQRHATALARAVDDAYERGDTAAEDLDAQLAALELDLWSRAEAWEEEGGDVDECDDAGEDPGVEEQLVAAWTLYCGRYADWSPQQFAHHVRSILFTASGPEGGYKPSAFHDPGDAALIRLARDLHAEEVRRRDRRRRPAAEFQRNPPARLRRAS